MSLTSYIYFTYCFSLLQSQFYEARNSRIMTSDPYWAVKAGFISITWSIEAGPLDLLYSHRSVRSTSRQWFASLPVLGGQVSPDAAPATSTLYIQMSFKVREHCSFSQMLIPQTKSMKLFFALNEPSFFLYDKPASSCPLMPAISHDILLFITILLII